MARMSRKKNTAEPATTTIHTYKTAVYVRLSNEDIRKKISDSIGTQKALLTDFIQAHPDLRLQEIFEDVNCTGTNFNRPAFARMITDIQAGRIDCVLVKDLSRFGRSFEEMGYYLERVFPLLQVRFIAVSDGYDSLTASIDESSLIVPLKNLMNEVYARDISKKVQSSVKMRQKHGQFCGSIAPYGYIKDGPAFIVDKEAAPIVKRIFELILEGYSDMAIAQQLNDLEILPPSRYRFERGITKSKKHGETRYWYKSAVKRIAENPAYTGVLAQAKFQSNFLQGGGRIAKERGEWIIAEGAHPAIIDSDTFEAVRKIRDARKLNYRMNKDTIPQDNIFKGLIICGDCKAHMARRRQRRAEGDEYCFQCNVYEQVDKHACTRKKIMEADLHATLFAMVSNGIGLAVDTSRIIAEIRKEAGFQGQAATQGRKTAAIQKKLLENRRNRGSLREDYVDGVLSKQDYACMKTEYDEEKDMLERELDALLADKLRQNNTLSPENKWTAEFRRFEMEERLSAQMVSALVERIEVFDGGRIEVSLRFRDEFEALRAYIENHSSERRAVNE